jgi:hypothetical protein
VLGFCVEGNPREAIAIQGTSLRKGGLPLNAQRKIWKTTIAALLLNAMLFVMAPPSARADDRDKCRRRIEKIEERLDREIAHHGEHSPQADARRRELREEREHCWSEYHAWWNGHEHQWHTEHDWDRDDHDHDHDHP